MWMLADALVKRGHSVLWWSSTFSHQRKTLLYNQDIEVEVKPQFKLKLVYVGGYKNNISLQRYRHHLRLAQKFSQQAKKLLLPDIIICAFPIIDLAHEVVAYAQTNNIPVIVDIRDLWPDIFIEKSPRILQGLVKIIFSKAFWKTRKLLQSANGLVAVSRGYLNWGLRNAERSETESDNVFYIGYREENTDGEETTTRVQNLRSLVENKVIFTYIGSFGHSYELEIICEVARRLLANGVTGAHFVLAGAGDKFEAISRSADSLPNMSVVGWLDKFEIRRLLQFSHVGLIPMVIAKDTMPNKLFEYMSAGLPVLSSLEGEIEEIIGEKQVGYSYHCGDIEALYGYVIKLIMDSDLRQRLAFNARKLFEHEFRAEVIYDAYVSHVEQIAAKKKRGNLTKSSYVKAFI
jgi:glycosyltransferase involved in cell wall biosynthesis